MPSCACFYDAIPILTPLGTLCTLAFDAELTFTINIKDCKDLGAGWRGVVLVGGGWWWWWWWWVCWWVVAVVVGVLVGCGSGGGGSGW